MGPELIEFLLRGPGNRGAAEKDLPHQFQGMFKPDPGSRLLPPFICAGSVVKACRIDPGDGGFFEDQLGKLIPSLSLCALKTFLRIQGGVPTG